MIGNTTDTIQDNKKYSDVTIKTTLPVLRKIGSGGIRTRASEETGALNQRLRPLGHATVMVTVWLNIVIKLLIQYLATDIVEYISHINTAKL